mgnify:CR=1 FL=1
MSDVKGVTIKGPVRLQVSNQGPRDIPIAGGMASITVRHADRLIRRAVRFKAEEEIRALKEGGDILEEFGYAPEEWPQLTDRFVMIGFAELLYAVNLVEMIGTGWTGLVYQPDPNLEKTEPVPFTREGMVSVMREYGTEFIAEEAKAFDALATEGNASAPLLNGNSVGAQNTAKAAAQTTPPALKDKEV